MVINTKKFKNTNEECIVFDDAINYDVTYSYYWLLNSMFYIFTAIFIIFVILR